MSRVEVCEEAVLDPGERVIVEVKGVEVGVFNIDGEFHALLNNCPHQNGPVCEGELVREIGGEFHGPGTKVEQVYTGAHTVACPWHAWSFDVETGEHSGDHDISIPTYDVVVDDGTVYLEI